MSLVHEYTKSQRLRGPQYQLVTEGDDLDQLFSPATPWPEDAGFDGDDEMEDIDDDEEDDEEFEDIELTPRELGTWMSLDMSAPELLPPTPDLRFVPLPSISPVPVYTYGLNAASWDDAVSGPRSDVTMLDYPPQPEQNQDSGAEPSMDLDLEMLSPLEQLMHWASQA